MKRQDIDFTRTYGDVPEAFSHRVAYALRHCEKEASRPMKRKSPIAILITVLCLALTTTAVAAALSQTVEFFVFEYGERYRETLESGQVAHGGGSATLNGVVYTLHDAVIVPSQTTWLYDVGEVDPPVDTLDFYATGVISPAEGENIILLSWDDYTVDDPAGYALYYPNWPKAPEGAPTYAELAREKGATIRMVSCIANGIINEETGEVYPNTIGGVLIPREDGTVQFGVEVPSEHVIPAQDSYCLSLYIATQDVDPEGNIIEGSQQSAEWIVTLAPTAAN